ncbi:insulinase family protein [Saccharospirillum impatiens]|uniref:insulinase family protein n=1 Tax=Saccharospirillum impatiens TaxID=169438 RepID=UPI00048B51B3|nr:insulinase family protein [Saccharospirillum impatiens]
MKRGVLIAITAGVIVVLASAGLVVTSAMQPGEENPSNIVVSEREDRVFHQYELENGLTVVLVSDEDAEVAAAALNVSVGSWSNPADLPGLAHFLEHMLFLGTEKYPQADEYHRFIEQNGGNNNAYTADENTLYYFDIDAEHLEPALDRLAQFFIAPLFDASYIEREINAVQSEFTASLQDDNRRREDAVREQINPDHPAANLAIGNAQTLESDQLRERMQTFYREHYVANRLSLAVVGPQDIETLKSWVDARFNQIRSVSSEPIQVHSPLFQASTLPMLIEVQPRRESRLLQFRFPVPATVTELDTKPYAYLASLLDHQGSGTLFAELKSRGWADGLSAHAPGTSRNSETFNVSVQLTSEGMANWQTMATLMFDYLQTIEQEGLNQWRYEELQTINRINFEFAEQVSPAATAQHLATRLMHYPADQILAGPYQLAQYDPEAIQLWLSYLKPDNALVVLMEPQVETDTTSQWYETPYKATPLSGTQVAQWRSPDVDAAMTLPEENLFIPEDLSVLPFDGRQSELINNTPLVIKQSPGLTVWFEQDETFRTPKLDITVMMESPEANASARSAIATRLFIDMVDDGMTDFRYDASRAGSGYGLSSSKRGLQLRLYGYSDRLHVLLDTLLVEMTDTGVSQARFEQLKSDLQRRLRNTSEDPVLNQMVRRLNTALIRDTRTPEALLAALDDLTLEDVLAQRDALLNRQAMTVLIHGNQTEGGALQLANRISAMLPPNAEIGTVRTEVAALPSRRYRHEMTIDHNDSALLGYYQGQDSSLRERALFSLLNRTLSAPYFAELRTEEQLGYIVFSQNFMVEDLPGLIVYIQSPGTDPALLQLFSDRFMNRYLQQLRSLESDAFNRYKAGLINDLTTPEQNLYELSQTYWQSIMDGNQNFNTRRRLASAVEAISLDGFTRFFENQMLRDDAKSLVLHQIGRGMEDAYAENGTNLVGFYPADDVLTLQEASRWITPTFNNLPVQDNPAQ